MSEAPRTRAAAVRVASAGGSEVAAPGAPASERIAVVVAHGMGQQVRFETLDMIIAALRRGARHAGVALDPAVRMAPLGGEVVPRADVRLAGADGAARELHFYEAYWAPIPEGRVGLRDVIAFLLTAGVDGARAAWRPAGFERLLFGQWRAFRIRPSIALRYALALVASCAVFLLGAVAVLAAAAASHLLGAYLRVDPARLALLQRDVALFGFAALQVLAGVALGGVATGRPAGAAAAALSWTGAQLVKLGLGLLVVAGALAAWDLSPWMRPPAPADPSLLLSGAPLRWVGTAVVVAIALWAALEALSRFRRLRATLRATLLIAAEASAIAIFATVVLARLFGVPVAEALAAAAPALAALCWGCAVLAIPIARWFLIEYVGDVAAYLSAHKVSRFDEVRKAIQKVASDLGRAVYEEEEEEGFVYDQVVWVGHSLGSVIAYDTVNTLVNEDLALTRRLRVAERTTAFLTVGSPLDKTAFLFRSQRPDPLDVREGLATARQPLIVDYALRPARWINLHSPSDWIGGALSYYDAPPEPGASDDTVRLWRQRRVRNHRDPRARTPLAAHVELFENQLFGRTLFRVLSGRLR